MHNMGTTIGVYRTKTTQCMHHLRRVRCIKGHTGNFGNLTIALLLATVATWRVLDVVCLSDSLLVKVTRIAMELLTLSLPKVHSSMPQRIVGHWAIHGIPRHAHHAG